MRSVSRVLKQVDLFGVELSLNIRQQDKYKSACSGIMSLLMIALLSYIVISGLQSMINKESYTIKIQSLQTNEPKYSIMNSDNFMMAVHIQDPFKIYYPTLNKTAFNITVEQRVINTLYNGSQIRSVLQSYQLEQCTEKHFGSINFEDKQQIKNQLQSYFCLPRQYELYLQGNYNSEIFYFPKLKIQLCTDGDCYSAEERDHVKLQISSLTLSTLISSNIFVSNRTEDFFFQYINSDFYLQTEYYQEMHADMFFKYNKIVIDDNVFGINTQPQEDYFWSFQLLDYREQQVENYQPDILFQLNFRLNPEADLITKTAYKLDQFISYLGGMLKFFSAIFGLIALRYNLLAMRLSLANSLYQFNIPQRSKEGNIEFSYDKLLRYIQFQLNRADQLLNTLKQHTTQVVKLGNIARVWNNASTSFRQAKHSEQTNNFHVQSEQPIILLNSYEGSPSQQNLIDYKENFLQQLIQKILESRKQLRLGINFIIYLLMCCQCFDKIRMTRQLIDQGNKMIQKDLDIVNILSKIQQIDKLKSVILDQDQISVFNYIPKPVVNLGKKNHQQILTEDSNEPNELVTKASELKKSRIISKQQHFNNPKKFLKIYDSYLKLKENNSSANTRLIEMLGSTIEMIFQKYHEIEIISLKKEDPKQIDEIEINLKLEQTDQLITTKKNTTQIQNLNFISPKILNDDEIRFE